MDIKTQNKSASISTKDLEIGYNIKGKQNKVVHNSLNLNLYPGEVTCLLGLNGAGKSTLIRTLCGFQPKLSGQITLLDKNIENYSQREISLNIGVVLTEKTNAGGITVYELVSLGRHPHTGFFGQLKEEDHNIIAESIIAAGISHKMHNYVAELSDGERQKVMIAKALAQQCPIIILDEPTAFLDVTSRIDTMSLLRKLATEQNKSILLSTHDLDLAIQMGDSLWLQKKGEPMCCGTPEDLILNNKLGKFFDKEGIAFDNTTGKLNIKTSNNPIGVEGDFNTTFWVGNALIRNGYKPSSVDKNIVNINCKSPNNIIIQYPNGETKIKINRYHIYYLIIS